MKARVKLTYTSLLPVPQAEMEKDYVHKFKCITKHYQLWSLCLFPFSYEKFNRGNKKRWPSNFVSCMLSFYIFLAEFVDCLLMASSFTSSKETTNYARLCRLLVDIGTQVLRETFERNRPPGDLHTVLTTPPVQGTLASLKKKRVLYPTQWGKLVSPTVSSKDFDITLLVVLLKNVCSLSPPATSWKFPPTPTDVSEAADIERIRIHRNEVYAHVNGASVDDATFNNHWVSIKDPLLRLGGPSYQTVIDNLETECMDPEKEQHYQNLLKQWKDNEESVMEKLIEIEEKLDANQSKLQKVDENLAKLVEPVTPSVKEVAVAG